MRKFLIAIVAVLVAMVGLAPVASATESPFVAIDTAAGGAQVASSVSTVTGSTVTLVQDGRATATAGTSGETPNLGLEFPDGGQLHVNYSAESLDQVQNGAVRFFAYFSANADTWNQAPDAVYTAASDNLGETMTLNIPAGTTVGTVGVVYDTSNPSEGTVVFSSLSYAFPNEDGVLLSFTEPFEQEPEVPERPAEEPDPVVTKTEWETTTEPTCDAKGEQTRIMETQPMTWEWDGEEWVAVPDGDPETKELTRPVPKLKGSACRDFPPKKPITIPNPFDPKPIPGQDGADGKDGVTTVVVGKFGKAGNLTDGTTPVSSVSTLPATGSEGVTAMVAAAGLVALVLGGGFLVLRRRLGL